MFAFYMDMSKGDFNKELNSYLKTRVKPVKKVRVSKKGNDYRFKSSDEEVPNMKEGEVLVIEGDKNIVDKIISLFKKKNKKEVAKEPVVQEIDEATPEEKKEFEEEMKEIDTETNEGIIAKILGFFRIKVEKEEIDELETEEQFEEKIEEIEKKEEEIEAEEEEIKAEKKSLISRLMGMFNKKEDVDMSSYENEELKNDLKEIAKIATDVMKKLDGEELRKFKQSEDFKKFMEILKNNKLVKEE